MMQVTKVWWDGERLMAEPIKSTHPQVEPNFGQLQELLNKLDRCLTRDGEMEFLRTWIRDWTEHKLSQSLPQNGCKYPMCHNEEYQQAVAEKIKQDLYTGKTWVGLTDYERTLICKEVGYNQFMTAGEYASLVQRATEAFLKAKNK